MDSPTSTARRSTETGWSPRLMTLPAVPSAAAHAPPRSEAICDARELVASQAEDTVPLARACPQAPRHISKDGISHGMPEVIVDLFEMIEVEQQDRRNRARLRGPLFRVHEGRKRCVERS